MTRDGHKSLSVAHDDMLTLPDHPESGFLESAYRVEMIDTREFRHGPMSQLLFRAFPDHRSPPLPQLDIAE
jgi:hypothetical protein